MSQRGLSYCYTSHVDLSMSTSIPGEAPGSDEKRAFSKTPSPHLALTRTGGLQWQDELRS